MGTLPSMFIQIDITYFLLRRLLGVRMEGDKKAQKVQKLAKGELLMVNIGSLSTGELLQRRNNNKVCVFQVAALRT